jgi:hypothetical protein
MATLGQHCLHMHIVAAVIRSCSVPFFADALSDEGVELITSMSAQLTSVQSLYTCSLLMHPTRTAIKVCPSAFEQTVISQWLVSLPLSQQQCKESCDKCME